MDQWRYLLHCPGSPVSHLGEFARAFSAHWAARTLTSAVVRPLATVDTQVFLQVSGGIKAFKTYTARERLLSCLFPLVLKAFFTFSAVIRLFSTVNSLMLYQDFNLFKTSTVRAGKRLPFWICALCWVEINGGNNNNNNNNNNYRGNK